MSENSSELFIMVAKPKAKEASAIQLSKNIWMIEDELDLLYSPAKNAFESYGDPGESKLLLKIDGTIVLNYPSEKECHKKFEDLEGRLAKSKVIPKMEYEKPELEKYKISKKIQGNLEDVAPEDLIAFLRGPQKKIQYDPKKISYEFIDPKNQKNFVRIIFDREMGEEKLLLDVTVESNDVKYARETMKEIESLLGK